MPRVSRYLALALMSGALITGCGSSQSTADSPVVTPPSSAVANASGAPAKSAHEATPSGSASAAAGATVARTSSASAQSSNDGTGSSTMSSNAVPLPPPGSYTYHQTGSASSALGKQSLDGDSTLTVDQPQGNREHSVQRDKGGSTEQVLVSRTDGLYLADIHLAQPGFDEDFRPSSPVLLFPGHAHKGQHWQWSMTSTDKKYTLTAQLQVTDLRSSYVVLSSVLHVHSNDINLTIHQRDKSGLDAVIQREHSVTDGTAYGTPFHSDSTRVLAGRPH